MVLLLLPLLLQVVPDVLSSFQPQLVLYDAGVDVHVDDDLGRLAVTDKGASRNSP
jgi:acetoin utilization deacetylase AcuC-like enzyme